MFTTRRKEARDGLRSNLQSRTQECHQALVYATQTFVSLDARRYANLDYKTRLQARRRLKKGNEMY